MTLLIIIYNFYSVRSGTAFFLADFFVENDKENKNDQKGGYTDNRSDQEINEGLVRPGAKNRSEASLFSLADKIVFFRAESYLK